MVQPAVRVETVKAAKQAALECKTPADVRQLEVDAIGSAPLAAFLQTDEWAEIRTRIVGDGKAPSGRIVSLADLARMMLYHADGTVPGRAPTPYTRRAFIFAADHIAAFERRTGLVASEIEAFMSRPGAVAPVSPAAPAVPAVRRVVSGTADLTFGDALLAAQAGRRIARPAWGSDTFVFVRPAAGVVAEHMVRSSSGAEVPWTPDQEALFADDWRVLSRPEPSAA